MPLIPSETKMCFFYRVGLKAAADFQVASPIDALTKAEVSFYLLYNTHDKTLASYYCILNSWGYVTF